MPSLGVLSRRWGDLRDCQPELLLQLSACTGRAPAFCKACIGNCNPTSKGLIAHPACISLQQRSYQLLAKQGATSTCGCSFSNAASMAKGHAREGSLPTALLSASCCLVARPPSSSWCLPRAACGSVGNTHTHSIPCALTCCSTRVLHWGR